MFASYAYARAMARAIQQSQQGRGLVQPRLTPQQWIDWTRSPEGRRMLERVERQRWPRFEPYVPPWGEPDPWPAPIWHTRWPFEE